MGEEVPLATLLAGALPDSELRLHQFGDLAPLLHPPLLLKHAQDAVLPLAPRLTLRHRIIYHRNHKRFKQRIEEQAGKAGDADGVRRADMEGWTKGG
jgi:hypothetical protein